MEPEESAAPGEDTEWPSDTEESSFVSEFVEKQDV